MNQRRLRQGDGVFELEGGVPLGPAVPPGYEGPPPEVPVVQTIEPTKGWWRKAGAFGQRQTFFPPADPDTVIALTEQLNLPGPPAPWWMNWFRFNRNQGKESENVGNYDLKGRIIYGVGGAQNTIDFDLIQGVQFPIVANSLTVQLVSVNPYADIDLHPYDPGEKKITAGCMFGKGGGGAGRLGPTWSAPIIESADNNGFQQLTIVPDFARSLVVHTSTISATELAKIDVNFVDLGGAVIARLNMAPASSYNVLTQEPGVPIPFGCNGVFFTADATTANGILAQIQFLLAL